MFAAPTLLILGALATLAPIPVGIGQLTVTVGLAAHAAQYVAIWRRQAMTATAVQALGAVTAVAASITWCGGTPPARMVPLLACFLILTIAGERLELARLHAPGPGAERLLFSLSLALAASTVLTLILPVVAVPIAGVALLGVVAWLVRYDVARVTVRMHGLPRFVALCLLTGYVWLAGAGAGWLLGGVRMDGPVYDATTHAIFLGFVITMIMAHAPIILPAVLRVELPYHPVLYAPVVLLQGALLVRVVAGDAWGLTAALQAGGIGAAVAMVLFVGTAATLAIRAGMARTREQAPPVAP